METVDFNSNSVISDLRNLEQLANSYFEACSTFLVPDDNLFFLRRSTDYFWKELSPELQQQSAQIIQELMLLARKAARLCSRSPLASEADRLDLGKEIKTLRAALELRRYKYLEAEVIHDEGNVKGILPASQTEDSPLPPAQASSVFSASISNLTRILDLTDPLNPYGSESGPSESRASSRYRPNTAFIMMWMDKTKPELEDVKDAIRGTFQKYGITAVRADDIEHEDVITARIIEYIKTSEFLFADLTGARQSVYYEVGYAHALGKRVILFRKKGTDLHFDLAGYNCPEYENLLELREMLSKRLEFMTNKSPQGGKN